MAATTAEAVSVAAGADETAAAATAAATAATATAALRLAHQLGEGGRDSTEAKGGLAEDPAHVCKEGQDVRRHACSV